MTMSTLALTLVLQIGESVLSFLSRLTAHNGHLCLRHFCVDNGIDFQGIVDGRDEDVERLADIADVPKSELRSWSFERLDLGTYLLRGNRFLSGSLRRNAFHVCPACLRDDISISKLDPELAAFGRSIWQVGHIRTCARHGISLVSVGQGYDVTLHDFTAMVRHHLDRLDALEAAAAIRPFSPFEQYVLNRIEGSSRATPFLDGLDLQVAAKFCEVLGVVVVHGPDQTFRQLGDGDLYDAAAAGFDVAAGGQEDVRGCLSEMQRSYPYNSSRNEGPGRPLGVLYKWLNGVRHQSGYAPLVDLVRRHLIDTVPVGPGDLVLGSPVERRVIHSVRTASLETGMHPKRLRKILARAGLLVSDHANCKDNSTFFDAEASSGILAATSDGMSLNEVDEYLNCGRVQAQVLLRNGFLEPFVHADVSDGWHLFARADVDDFLTRLLAGAVPVERPANHLMDIPSTARRCNCGAAEIVRLVLDGKLQWVGRRVDERGYRSLLLDPAHLRPFVEGDAIQDLGIRETRAALKTSDNVINQLIEIGALIARSAVNPQNRCPMRVVEQNSFDDFRMRYVSITELSNTMLLSRTVIFQNLSKAGIYPVWDRGVVDLLIYRVTEIEPYAEKLRQEGRLRRRGRPPREQSKPPRGRGRARLHS